MEQKSNNVLKDIIVKDINDVNKEDGVLIQVSVDINLQQCRKSLEKDIKYPYVFLSNEKGFKISLGSEKTKRISSILGLTGGDTIYIKTSKPEKQVVVDKKVIINQKLEEGKKAKAEVEALITELNTFAQERKVNAAANLAKAEQRLNKIHQGLNRAGLSINKENSDAYIKQANQFLNNNLKDANHLCATLSAQPDISERQLLSNFKGVCQAYYFSQPVSERIIDIEKSSYSIDNTAVGGDSTFCNFFKKESSQKFSTALENSFTAGEINVGAVNPVMLLKAGFDVNVTDAMKQERDLVQQSQYISTVYFSINIGRGFSFGIDDVKIKEEVIDKYEKLVKSYFQHKDIENLKSRCLEFLKHYGYEIDLGTYLFGSTYRLVNEISFNQKHQKSKLQKTACTALNASITAGGFCQIGLLAGKGELNIKRDKGSHSGSEYEGDTGTCVGIVKAFPNVLTEKVWRELATVRLDSMKILGSKKSDKVQLVIVMRNKKNKTPYLSQLDENGKIGEFEKYFTQLYCNSILEIPKVKNQTDLHIVLVGPTGAGKSYFGNQLVGIQLTMPFRSSANVLSETLKVQRHVKDSITYYDTPGLFDNRSLDPGHVPRALAQIVNVERSSKDYKYVNCFLLVVKLVDRLQVMESINVLIHMFGVEVLKSLILVINMTPDAQKINSLDSLKKNVPNFADIKKLYSGFDLDKQVYWNYFFDLDRKVLKDWWVMYGKHRAELLSRILKLHRYDSVHYNKYLETIKEKEKQQLLNQEERNKAIEEKIKKQMKDKEQNKLTLDVENFFKNISYFRLFSKQSKCYISYARIAFYLFYIPKGFNLVSDISNLFLTSTQVDVKSGSIQGYLGCERRPEVRMSTDGQEMLGYRDPKIHDMQSVSIEFLDGKTSMVSAKEDRSYIPRVRVSILGRYLKDDKGVLKRDDYGNEGSIFEMMM